MDQSYTLLNALLVGGFVLLLDLLFKEGGGPGACLLDLYCTDKGVTVTVALGEFLTAGREAGPALVGLEDGLEDAGRDVSSLTELVGLCGGVTVAVALGEFLIAGREAGPVLVGLEDAGSGLEDAERDLSSLTELVGLCGGGRNGPLVGGLGGGRLGLETVCPLVTFLL